MTQDVSEKIYSAISSDMTGWVIAAHPNHGIAFRFGPFPAKEIGAIITKCLELNVKPLITMECGTTIDWELMQDVCSTLPEINKESTES